jgi:hypothetical protein
VTNAVKGFARAITGAVKNFKLSKFFAPLMKGFSKFGSGIMGFIPGFKKFMGVLRPLRWLIGKIALPLTIALEAFEAFNMMFVGSFSKNAEKLADDISEKGVLGRMWYGFTHMFTTIIAAVKTNFDTMMQTFDILFSDHPDGIVGKLKNVGEIILTPIVELFKDFVIYPIQKALSWIPFSGVDDPDDAAAALKKERAEIGMSVDEEGVQRSDVSAHSTSKRVKELAADAAYKAKNLEGQAQKVGLTVDEYLQYKKERSRPGSYKILTVDEWLKSKEGKINQSPALPKPNTTGPYQGQGEPHGQALLQQNAAQYNTTYEVKLPSAGEIINQ